VAQPKKGKIKLQYLESDLYLLSVLLKKKIMSCLQERVRITKADKTLKCGLMVEMNYLMLYYLLHYSIAFL